MQGVFRDAILNKVSTFTADPHFRHIIGQGESTFDLITALDQGYWVILNLSKGRLGEQAATLGTLFLGKLKNALFARQYRKLFTFFCDEVQNLVAYDTGLDTLLSEARKFAVGICSANQFLDQYPQQMRAAIMAIGTHICFQPSSGDADKLSHAFDGGKALAERLKNLPQRHFIVKSGHLHWREVVVPNFIPPKVPFHDLLRRSQMKFARKRSDIESDIQKRRARYSRKKEEVLSEWE
jgi:hypothetical protein